MSKVAAGWRECSHWQNQRHIDDRHYIVLNGGFRAASSEIRAAALCLLEPISLLRSWPCFFVAVNAADLSCQKVALSTDTSAILSEKELYGFPGSFPKILAIPGFGSLVFVQVVEFQKSHCHAAGTQEERRNAYRR